MPSIEIACLGLERPAPIAAKGFILQVEPGLVSHQAQPRFQKDFDELEGCLYHLGFERQRDPHLGRPFTAYELLSPACREPFPPSILEFAAIHLPEIRAVLAAIVAASPLQQALFTTDWQYGPEWAHRFGPVTQSEFWHLHTSRLLYLNTAYEVVP
jgi:hypothetical protein